MNGDIPSVPIITLAGVSSLTNGTQHFSCYGIWGTGIAYKYSNFRVIHIM